MLQNNSKKSTLIKFLIAGVFKSLAAVAAFMVTAIVTRNMDSTNAGFFLLGFTILAISSILLRLGLDNIVLRELVLDPFLNEPSVKLSRAIAWVLMSTGLYLVVVVSYAFEIAEYVFEKPGFHEVLFWFSISVPAVSLSFLISLAFQSQNRVVMTILFQGLGVSLFFVIICLIVLMSGKDFKMDASFASRSYCIASYFVLILSLCLWYRQEEAKFQRVAIIDKEMWSSCVHLWLASAMGISVKWSGVLIAGAMVSAADFAGLSAVQRTANLVGFILIVVNMVVAPRYAVLWKENKVKEIEKLAKWSSRIMVVLASLIVFNMMFFSESIMLLFGEGYQEFSHLLVIIVVGQFVNVATGSVGYLLNMSGHEKDYNKVSMLFGPITIILALVLTYNFGVLGAAYAISIGIALQNIGALWMVKKRLGFIPVG